MRHFRITVQSHDVDACLAVTKSYRWSGDLLQCYETDEEILDDMARVVKEVGKEVLIQIKDAHSNNP